ncbi:hypothetical protein [Maribacter hydrothermalis]|uniref:Uncharacterized protein n=1 Tax=Maribacter hydrothermalis TaxID=1836467 RepID=A0A1B7Z4C5_9FLAO|nr:hypothetical protein [Maribacter hydrothermalis]APQ17285.1 hypothetical protein BTR34_08070 [Maribacter hydrothermalis]OBR37544.1 hypothetical protein A9200_07820 [Maribacter hydrothermalis]
MKGLQEIKSAIDIYVNGTNKSALEVVEALNKYYFNKAVTAEITLYKKKKKKVAQITKDLKISHRRFYKILEDKKVEFTKYNKTKEDEQ